MTDSRSSVPTVHQALKSCRVQETDYVVSIPCLRRLFENSPYCPQICDASVKPSRDEKGRAMADDRGREHRGLHTQNGMYAHSGKADAQSCKNWKEWPWDSRGLILSLMGAGTSSQPARDACLNPSRAACVHMPGGNCNQHHDMVSTQSFVYPGRFIPLACWSRR